jgi:hypothetical protein
MCWGTTFKTFANNAFELPKLTIQVKVTFALQRSKKKIIINDWAGFSHMETPCVLHDGGRTVFRSSNLNNGF